LLSAAASGGGLAVVMMTTAGMPVLPNRRGGPLGIIAEDRRMRRVPVAEVHSRTDAGQQVNCQGQEGGNASVEMHGAALDRE